MPYTVRTHNASTHATPLHTFSVSQVSTSVLTDAFPPPLNTHTPSLQSVHQSSCLSLTLINSDSQNLPLSLPFLSLHPSILLKLHTHFLPIYPPLFLLSLVLLHSHVMSVSDIEEIIVFLPHCFETVRSSFLIDSIKKELCAVYNHRSDTIVSLW